MSVSKIVMGVYNWRNLLMWASIPRRENSFLCVCLFVWIVFTALALPSTALAGRFDCPYLYDTSRQTLSPMTQGKEGWFFRRSDLLEFFELLPETQHYLTRLNNAFEKSGAKLVILAIPPRALAAQSELDANQPMQDRFDPNASLENYTRFLGQLRSTGAEVVDVLDVMQQTNPTDRLDFFFRRDNHWTPFGAELAAQSISKALQNDPVYVREEHSEYTSKPYRASLLKHAMAQELQQLCVDDIPAEPFEEYITQHVAESGEDALFGDATSGRPIVLLGSSFSAQPMFNFDGFLSQYTGLEVANYAISSGALFNAIISYTSLPKSERLDPAFVVWEALAHYDFNLGNTYFRQIIPAIDGECAAQEAVASQKIKIKNGKPTQIFKLAKRDNISGSDYFLFIQTQEPSFTHFTLEMEHADGDGEWFMVDRSEHFNNKGRFFIELSEALTAPLIELTINGMPAIDAELDVRLCRIKKEGEMNAFTQPTTSPIAHRAARNFSG